MRIRHFSAEDAIDTCIGASCVHSGGSDWQSPWHEHGFFEMLLVEGGQLLLNQDENCTRLKPGSLVLLRPGDVHCLERVLDAPFRGFFLKFPESALKETARFLGSGFDAGRLFDPAFPPTYTLTPAERMHWARRFQRVGRALTLGRPVAKAVLRSTLAEALTSFFVEERPASAPEMPGWLATTCREMHKKENFVAGLPALYRIAPRSKTHVSHLLMTFLGKTPTTYVNGLRLDHAAELLAATDVKVMSIAWDCGFGDISHFYRRFKCRFGISPGAFRKNARRAAAFRS